MLDRRVLDLSRGILQALARALLARGLKADHLSWGGFVIGLGAVPLIAGHQFAWAALLIVVNRLADGLDGTMARLTSPTDRGAFLDISLDFLFYQFAHRLALVFFLVCCCGRYGFIRKGIKNCLLRSKHICDAFINAVLAQQAVHQHIACLSHAVCAGNRLIFNRRFHLRFA